MNPHGVVTEAHEPVEQAVHLILGKIARAKAEVHAIKALGFAGLIGAGKMAVGVTMMRPFPPHGPSVKAIELRSSAEPGTMSRSVFERHPIIVGLQRDRLHEIRQLAAIGQSA